MPTSVKLQDMMSYSLIMTIIAVVLILVPVILIIVFKLSKIKPKKKVKRVYKAKPKKKMDPVTLKNVYLEKIKDIETRYVKDLISLRQAHIELSKTVREYCAEASHVPAESLTLKEIEHLNVPSLYLLIKEFYEPEFAHDSDKDIRSSFTNAKEVIRSWN